MGTALQTVLLLLVAAIALLGSRWVYLLNVRIFSKNELKRRDNASLEELKFSFEKMVYAIPIPTNQPSIIQAGKERFRIVEDFDSWIYPRLNGIRVLLKPQQGDELLIAYLSTDQFRVPILDRLLVDGKISRQIYRRISAAKLTMLSTKAEIIGEVYSKIHNKRFS